jgi:site-specific recombinase XerD
MLETIDHQDMHGTRDRALLLLGFACALRRSEIVALKVEDLEEAPGGITVQVRKSKTDQEQRGQTVPLPTRHFMRPVQALRDWLDRAGITEGHIFRRISPGGTVLADPLSGAVVAAIVKRYCPLAGLDPASFAGHSLRAGFVTSAVEEGASAIRIADVTRHRDLNTVLIYVRRLNSFVEHPLEKVL